MELFGPLDQLGERADLTMYSTPLAMDDLAELCSVLGYQTVNLFGGSYGTRAALIFMRRHPATVRSAILMGVAPLMFRNPLHHAWSAQQGLERKEQVVVALHGDNTSHLFKGRRH